MSSMELTIIGSDGSWPRPGGACSSYLLRSRGATVLIDLGVGALAKLQQVMDPRHLDAVFVSHRHPDHCADLAPLNVMFKQSVEARTDLPVYAAAGVKEQIFGDADVTPQFLWTDLEHSDEIEVGDLLLTTATTDHPVPTLAFRIDCADRSMLFTSDTGTGWDASTIGQGVDLALCEAAMPSHMEAAMHLNSVQAAQLAVDASAKQLLLTHIRPDFDAEHMRREAAEVFGGPVAVAEPASVWPV